MRHELTLIYPASSFTTNSTKSHEENQILNTNHNPGFRRLRGVSNFEMRYLVFVIRYSLLHGLTRFLKLRNSLFGVCYSIFDTCFSIPDTRYSIFYIRLTIYEIRTMCPLWGKTNTFNFPAKEEMSKASPRFTKKAGGIRGRQPFNDIGCFTSACFRYATY
jgi:hypothetical protein